MTHENLGLLNTSQFVFVLWLDVSSTLITHYLIAAHRWRITSQNDNNIGTFIGLRIIFTVASPENISVFEVTAKSISF